MGRQRVPVVAAALLVTLAAWPVRSEENAGCRVFCRPELKFEPTWSLENAFGAPRVESTGEDGSLQVAHLPRATVFEAVFALDVPTRVPWLGLTLEAAFPPFEDENEVELEAEVNFALLTPERTGGWIDAHFDVIDKYSPAERPGDDDAYTHKLNFELDVAVAAFQSLAEDRYLQEVEVELSLDYLATGLPKRGDVIDGRRFLDDASPWSISWLLVFPLAPWPG